MTKITVTIHFENGVFELNAAKQAGDFNANQEKIIEVLENDNKTICFNCDSGSYVFPKDKILYVSIKEG